MSMPGRMTPRLRLTAREAAVLQAGAAQAGLRLPGTPDQLSRWLGRRQIALGIEQAAALAQGLAAVDLEQMRAEGPGRPRLRDLIRTGRVRYERRDPSEDWLTWLQLRASGQADCEDLAAAWAAESQADGWDPAAHPIIYRVTDSLAHVAVRSPGYDRIATSGYAIIDPSRLAGMRGAG